MSEKVRYTNIVKGALYVLYYVDMIDGSFAIVTAGYMGWAVYSALFVLTRHVDT